MTAGATQAILTAVLCCVHPGDEVIVLEPCYDSYEPSITMAGARCVGVPLTPVLLRRMEKRSAVLVGLSVFNREGERLGEVVGLIEQLLFAVAQACKYLLEIAAACAAAGIRHDRCLSSSGAGR